VDLHKCKFSAGLFEDEFKGRIRALLSEEDLVVLQHMLAVVIAAQEPLPLSCLPQLLGQDEPVVMRVVGRLATFFPVRDRRLHIFHKSICDFLIAPERSTEELWVDLVKVSQ
jgi:hypothetical protein